jgi:hypothetical protein
MQPARRLVALVEVVMPDRSHRSEVELELAGPWFTMWVGGHQVDLRLIGLSEHAPPDEPLTA